MNSLNEKKNLKRSVSYKWLKLSFIKKDNPPSLFWIFPKKHIPLAVTRNRLKRWGRLAFKEQMSLKNLQKRGLFLEKKNNIERLLSGDWLFFALKEKNFYKTIKKKDFDHVFNKAFESLVVKTQAPLPEKKEDSKRDKT